MYPKSIGRFMVLALAVLALDFGVEARAATLASDASYAIQLMSSIDRSKLSPADQARLATAVEKVTYVMQAAEGCSGKPVCSIVKNGTAGCSVKLGEEVVFGTVTDFPSARREAQKVLVQLLSGGTCTLGENECKPQF